MKLEKAILSSHFKNEKQRAAVHIMYAAWYLKSGFSKGLKQLGLTHEQYNVLRILKGSHPAAMCNKDIGNRMIEKGSNVPRIIDRLEAKRLVTRFTSSKDRRETLVTISDEGIALLQIATTGINRAIEKHLKLTESKCAQLNSLLNEFLDN